MYPYGLIGNCQASALVNNDASIDWLSFPNPDSPPVFGRLLDEEGGGFSILPEGKFRSEQRYLHNTNVLVTTIEQADGSSYQITDFFPRFLQYGRIYRPNSLFRIVEKKSGSPVIRVSCRPIEGWEKRPAKRIRGSSHIRWEIRNEDLRLLTNMSLTYLVEETPFVLEEPVYLGLSWGLGIEDDIARVSRQFLEQTIDYWRTWVKHCSIPSLYQKETIRSALTLKLHCFEDTGAILAASSTSLPEEIGGNRNWDYRHCWLRDAYFVLSAFRSLGHFEEMEGFLKFLLNAAHSREKTQLSPVYSLAQSLPLPETEQCGWRGYKGSVPVRNNNQAAEHVQNDVYGEMILTLAPIFLDERFYHLRTKAHEDLISHLAGLCGHYVSKHDAGLWELRNGWQEHSFSNLMCWAGLDRAQKIREAGYFAKGADFSSMREKAERAVRAAVHEGSVRNGPKDPSLDSALLQLPILRFPDADINAATVRKIRDDLMIEEHGFLYRYKRKDDFGTPGSAFLACSYWLVQAHAALGQIDQATDIMGRTIQAANPLGLLSEHYDPTLREQRGNFPQTYSHVGQINSAFAISPAWDCVL